MSPERIRKLIEEIDSIVEEEGNKPVLVDGQGIQRAIDTGKLAAVQDVLRAVGRIEK